MSEWPKMLYRAGGDDEVFGLKCETRVADTQGDEIDLADKGWFRTPFEAHGQDAPKADPVEDVPPVSDDQLSLLEEIDQLRRDVTELREQLAAAEGQRAATAKELAETRELLSEATKPAEKPKGKETLTVKS
jgi:hypothetical protein